MSSGPRANHLADSGGQHDGKGLDAARHNYTDDGGDIRRLSERRDPPGSLELSTPQMLALHSPVSIQISRLLTVVSRCLVLANLPSHWMPALMDLAKR